MKKTTHKIIKGTATTLLVVGGLAWGIYALANVDIVDAILGSVPYAVKSVRILVGAAAIPVIIYAFKK